MKKKKYISKYIDVKHDFAKKKHRTKVCVLHADRTLRTYRLNIDNHCRLSIEQLTHIFKTHSNVNQYAQ